MFSGARETCRLKTKNRTALAASCSGGRHAAAFPARDLKRKYA
jgi:hypothetical protein